MLIDSRVVYDGDEKLSDKLKNVNEQLAETGSNLGTLSELKTQEKNSLTKALNTQKYFVSIEEFPRIVPEVSDSPRIQRALDFMSTNKLGCLLFEPKTYEYTSKTELDSNVKLIGSGIDRTILKWKDDNLTEDYMLIRKLDSLKSNIYISDMTINHNRALRNIVENQTHATIDLSGMSNVIIERCKIKDSISSGIAGANCSNITIQNNVIENTGHHVLYFSHAIDNVVIDNNELKDPATITGRAQDGFILKLRAVGTSSEEVKNVWFTNNKLGVPKVATGTPISVYFGQLGVYKNIRITGNTFNRSEVLTPHIPFYSVSQAELISVDFSGNKLFGDGTQTAITIFEPPASKRHVNVNIKNNEIYKFAQATNVQYATVENNEIVETLNGIGGKHCLFKTNKIRTSLGAACGFYWYEHSDVVGNTVEFTGTAGTGLLVNHNSWKKIMNNTIINAVDGIKKAGSGVIDNNDFAGNKFINCTNRYTSIPYATNKVEFNGGTTAERPTTPFAYQTYFDTTLNKLITWNGSAWKDATGTTV